MKNNLHPAVSYGTAAVAVSATAFITSVTSLTNAEPEQVRHRHKSFQTHKIIPEKELIISDLSVVESPHAEYPGRLSFGYLMEQAFGHEKAPEIVRDMLMSWEKTFKIAGRVVEPRKNIRHLVIEPWMKRDGYTSSCGEEWKPDLANAPFNLLAIVNRMDMGVNPETLPKLNLDNERRNPNGFSPTQNINPGFYLPVNLPKNERPFTPGASTSQYYGGIRGLDSQAGEGRLVFGLTDMTGEPMEGGFTLILEYGLPAQSQRTKLYQWAMDWHSLGEHQAFDAAYMDKLVKVVDQFTRRQKVVDGKVTGTTASQLIRIRTNDGVLDHTREFREFRLTPSNMLTPAPLAGTVADEFFVKRSKENRALSRWLKDKEYDALKPDLGTRRNPTPTARENGNLANISIPATLRVGKKEVIVATGAARVIDNDKDHHWEGRSLSEEMRRNFSLQCCTGCHCGETGAEYFHIAPRRAGEPSKLSKFLNIKGKTLRHRAPGSRSRHNYQEVKDRMLTLKAYLNPGLNSKEFAKLREQRRGRAH